MKLSELEDKKILIVGKGVEGQASFAYLSRHFPSQKITIVDQKDGASYLENQGDYDIAIKSPGVHPDKIKIPYTTSTNIFFANARGKIIGITGTKGKSTTTSLIFEMLLKQGLKAHLGGNIGVSILEFLDELEDDSWSVLELSSFQLADIKYSPHIAVPLMIAPEHLDYHGDLYNYVDAKRNILKFQTQNDFAIVNHDYIASNESDVYTDALIYKISREQEVFQGCYIKDDKIYLKMHGDAESILDISEVKLKGKHNLENICSAIVAALCAGATMKSVIPVIKTFSGLEHRLEYVAEKNGVIYYNDSLATIPEATIEAIEALGEVETLIAGGHDRGINFDALGSYLSTSTLKNLILFPTTGEKIWEALCNALPNENLRPKKHIVTTMEEAVRIASENTTNGKICLMSPAASSFNLFKDYKDRGEQFKKAVNNLQFSS